MVKSDPGWCSHKPLHPAGTISVTIALIKCCTYPSAFMWVIDSRYIPNTHTCSRCWAFISCLEYLVNCKALLRNSMGNHLCIWEQVRSLEIGENIYISNVLCAFSSVNEEKFPVFGLLLAQWQIFSAVVEERHHADT